MGCYIFGGDVGDMVIRIKRFLWLLHCLWISNGHSNIWHRCQEWESTELIGILVYDECQRCGHIDNVFRHVELTNEI